MLKTQPEVLRTSPCLRHDAGSVHILRLAAIGLLSIALVRIRRDAQHAVERDVEYHDGGKKGAWVEAVRVGKGKSEWRYF